MHFHGGKFGLRKAVKKLALAVLLSYPVVADLRDVGNCP
jgi:hypothetical protein